MILVGNNLDLAENDKKVKSVKTLHFDTKKADALYKNILFEARKVVPTKCLLHFTSAY